MMMLWFYSVIDQSIMITPLIMKSIEHVHLVQSFENHLKYIKIFSRGHTSKYLVEIKKECSQLFENI